ncbi:MAG: hypothetical protein D6761_02740 [Candidatus Dadabacteria bacterium]|nr:MAG: hypothetical protein D6761_02740 [Candidatus Dadabacteria bacterium]
MNALSLMVLLPLVAGVVAIAGRLERYARPLALGGIAAAWWNAATVWQQFDASLGLVQLRDFRPLFGSAAFAWNLGIDGWTILPLLAVLAVATIALLGQEVGGRAPAWLAVMTGAALGAVASLNLGLTLFFILVVVIAFAFATLDQVEVVQGIRTRVGFDLLAIAVALLAGWMVAGSGAAAPSFNLHSLLREARGVAQPILIFQLMLLAAIILAGGWPAGEGRRRLATQLDSALLALLITLPGLIAFTLVARFLLPLFPALTREFALTVVAVCAVLAGLSGVRAWARDELREQLVHLAEAATLTAIGALFVLQTNAAVGAVIWVAATLVALAGMTPLMAGIVRGLGGRVDWWAVQHFARGAGRTRWPLLILFAVVVGLPVTISGAAWAGWASATLQQLVTGVQTGVYAEAAMRLVWLFAPVALIVIAASQPLFWLLQRRPEPTDPPLLLREVTASAIAVLLLGWATVNAGVFPALVERSVEYTMGRQLNPDAPVRAPAHEQAGSDQPESGSPDSP